MMLGRLCISRMQELTGEEREVRHCDSRAATARATRQFKTDGRHDNGVLQHTHTTPLRINAILISLDRQIRRTLETIYSATPASPISRTRNSHHYHSATCSTSTQHDTVMALQRSSDVDLVECSSAGIVVGLEGDWSVGVVSVAGWTLRRMRKRKT